MISLFVTEKLSEPECREYIKDGGNTYRSFVKIKETVLKCSKMIYSMPIFEEIDFLGYEQTVIMNFGRSPSHKNGGFFLFIWDIILSYWVLVLILLPQPDSYLSSI